MGGNSTDFVNDGTGTNIDITGNHEEWRGAKP